MSRTPYQEDDDSIRNLLRERFPRERPDIIERLIRLGTCRREGESWCMNVGGLKKLIKAIKKEYPVVRNDPYGG